MKKVFDIAFKDMTQSFRSMIAIVMMFAVPILLVGMFYIMFGGNNSEEEQFDIPVTKVILVNQDAGEIELNESLNGTTSENIPENLDGIDLNSMGSFLTDMLLSDEFTDLMSVTVMDDAQEAKNVVDRQEAGVAILIPENFSNSLTTTDGQSLVEFYQDPALTIGPNIVKGVIQQILDEFNSSRLTLQVTFEQMIRNGMSIDGVTTQVVMESYFKEMLHQQQGQNPARLMNVQSPAGEQVDQIASAGMVSMMMTGMTVFYVFFTGASSAQSLLTEEQKGTLPRLFTTPTGQSVILGGKFLSSVLMIIVQITVLMLFGNLVFKIEWGRLLTLLPVILAMTLAAASFGIFLLSWVRTERQAGILIGGFVTIMGMLGMLPIFVLSMPNPPQIVFSLSRLVPQGWAVDGLQIAMEGGGPSDVLTNTLVLMVWALLFFVIGVLRFRKRFAEKENQMRIIELALNDLLQIIRDWKAAFFLIVMPIGFTLLFGFIFNEQSGEGLVEQKLPVVIVNTTQDWVGSSLTELMDQSETIRPLSPEDGQTLVELKEQVEAGDLAAIVLVPEGYSAAILAGNPPGLDVIINTESGAGVTAQWAVQSVISRLIKAVDSAQFSTKTRGEIVPFTDDTDQTNYWMASLEEAVLAWENPAIQLVGTQTGQDPSEDANSVNAFSHSSPGMMVQFAIAGLIGSAEVLVLERKSGSLRRLLTTPIRRYEVLLGHFLAMVIMIFTQFAILILFAQLFLGVPYFSAPFASFLVALSTAVFSATVGLLIGALAKTSEQVVVFSLIPMFVLSGLGGAWVPLEFTGEAFQKVAYLTPLAWSMTGFKNIIERGLGLESVLLPVAVLISFALVIFFISVWRFQFEEA